ncbi:MAG: hypothetical protein Q7S45_01505 [Candidatus Curtissbacteria bacterium]|nr:hypothetical protein [Candidatus Curtissbacteria bacterium]
MQLPIKPRTAARAVLDPFETLTENFAPMGQDILKQMGGDRLGFGRPQTIGKEELARERKKKELQEKEKEDDQNSQKTYELIQTQYREQQTAVNREQREIKEEVVTLTSEVVKLAKSAGVDTKIHLETLPKKIGVIDIKRLTAIVRFLRVKATEAKSGSELVSQRKNAKRTTGMLAWVNGKQMKIHEQGTMQLQG